MIESAVNLHNVDGVPTVKGVVCGFDKKYHPPVMCEVVVPKCAPYQAPEHGAVSPTGPVEEGECVHVECDDPYQMAPGSESRACCVEGQKWDPPRAECEPLQQCPPFPTPLHGRVKPNGVTHVGDQVAVSCDAGYRLCVDCSDIATCTGTSYDIGPVTCVKEDHCDPFIAPPHATVTPTGNVTEGHCVHIQCDPGYLYDNTFSGKSDPCCVLDIVAGKLGWQQGKICAASIAECVVCNDITICPHCFIGPKVAPAKRREVHFDR